MNLLTLMLSAPVCGMQSDGDVVHAVDMDAMSTGWPDTPPLSACGLSVRYLASTDDVLRWPVKASAIRDLGWTRCRDCADVLAEKRHARRLQRAAAR